MYQLILFLLFFFCNVIKAADTLNVQLAEGEFVSLNTDEVDVFTLESIKELISLAKGQGEPALLCMVDKDARFVFDADSFWTYAKQNEDEVINPSNRQPISHVSLISVHGDKARIIVDADDNDSETDLRKKHELLQCYINAHATNLKSDDKVRAKMVLAEKLYCLKQYPASFALLKDIKQSSALKGLHLARRHYFLGLHYFRGTVGKADLNMAEQHMNKALKLVDICKQKHAMQKGVPYKNMFASRDLKKYENFEQKTKKALEAIKKKKDAMMHHIIEEALAAAGI